MSIIREMIAEAWADYRPWWVCYLVSLGLFLGLGVYGLAVAEEVEPSANVPVPLSVLSACQQQGGCVLISRERLAEMIQEAMDSKRREMHAQCGRGA